VSGFPLGIACCEWLNEEWLPAMKKNYLL